MNKMILRERAIKKNPSLKKNYKACKKSEHKLKKVGFKAKIYKPIALVNNQLLDMTSASHTTHISNYVKPENFDGFINVLDTAEIVGLSGGGFKTSIKIKALHASPETEKVLIVNAVECDLGLLHDEWLLQNEFDSICQGIRALMHYISFKKVIIATRIPVASGAEDSLPGNVEIKLVDYHYPMGEEHVLVNHVLNARLEKNDVPADHGILVQNVQTVIAIGKAIDCGEILNKKYFTVCDFYTGEARIVKAVFGADPIEVINESLGHKEDSNIYFGGGAMYAHQLTTQELISPSTGFIAYGNPIEYADVSKCKGCGKCTRMCPAGVNVKKVVRNRRRGETAVDVFSTKKCLGCNSCSFFCIAGINTMNVVKEYNDELDNKEPL